MGVLAEFIANKHKIDRRSQDEWALISHQRAVEATANGVFQDEIAPVTITDRRGNETTVADDEGTSTGLQPWRRWAGYGRSSPRTVLSRPAMRRV